MSVWLVILSTNVKSERKYPLDISIGDLKRKIYTITGIETSSQRLELSQTETAVSTILSDDERTLASYSPVDYAHLKVVNLNPTTDAVGFDDEANVPKFELSQEEYDKRTDTVKAFIERHKLGRFADHPGSTTTPSSIPIGARCKVRDADAFYERRGLVRFVGTTSFGKSPGSLWVGVELDEPLGKNDGSVQGERYFDCRPKHGVFVKPEQVNIGEFPPIDITEEDEM
ncbi:hypothetical protein DL93DRAFT_2135908 [Clavulina sp. PMI_390]|nr:hypothetical protein DL93DRAFT_2135908 [Clavulina sp. PMI_390]